MSAPRPIRFNWDGESMTPVVGHARLADQQFVVGEQYILVQQEQRSQASHNHYFAAVAEGWRNLPEADAERFPTDEHLRKWCLIKAGYRDERSIVCASKAEARRMAAFVKPMDEFAVVTVSESVVRVYTARSQSKNAMGKQEFQKSKSDVLEIIAEMVGVKPDQLRREAGMAA